MLLSFADELIHSICEDPEASQLGTGPSATLRRLLADLEAADTLAELEFLDLLPFNMRPGRIEFELGESTLLICRTDHVLVRLTPEGEPRWDRSHRIQVVSIEQLEASI